MSAPGRPGCEYRSTQRAGSTVWGALLACLAAAWLAAATLPDAAGEAIPTDTDPLKQARAMKLAERLRCLVCQNQTIAESNAELAVDLRRQVREQIAAGKSDDQILDYMTARYGDFVLYQPPVKGTTLLLWGGPILLLVGGLAVLVVIVRGRRRTVDAPPLTPEERARAAQLLAETDRKDNP
jgi:cytochrome c-type biogenesis protein CcmH